MPKKKKTISSQKITLKGVLLNYVNLIQPGYDYGGALKFMSLLTFPDDHPQVEMLDQVIQELADRANLDDWDSPIREPYERGLRKSESKQVAEGELGLNAKSAFDESQPRNGQPVLCDAARNTLTSSIDVYSGCTANASIQFYVSHDKICVGLNGVQVTHKGERLDGMVVDASEIFEEVEGFSVSDNLEQLVDDEESEIDEAVEEIMEPRRRGRGRPLAAKEETPKRRRGRPPASVAEEEVEEAEAPKRRRGRPKKSETETKAKTQSKPAATSARRRKTEEVPDIFEDEEDLI